MILGRVVAGTVASAAVLALAVSGPEPATTSTTTSTTLPRGTCVGTAENPCEELIPPLVIEVDTSPTSSDGRYHECGLVTEDGVTEYLDTYYARCGDATYAGDAVTAEVTYTG